MTEAERPTVVTGLTPPPERPRRFGVAGPGLTQGIEPRPSAPSGSGRTQTSKGSLPARSFGLASPLLDAMSPDLAETFHYLIARLQIDESEPLPNRIGVVSATHGEGVTTIARAFSATLANDLDATVCLVDLHASSASPRSKGDGGPHGLYEVLAGKATLRDALIKTADPRLAILHAGACDETEARSLARAAGLAQVLDELKATRDYVIVDVPPILAGSEGLALLRHMTGYLMVVRHGATPVDQVRAAAEEIKTIPSIGVVLNQFSSKIPKRLQRYF